MYSCHENPGKMPCCGCQWALCLVWPKGLFAVMLGFLRRRPSWSRGIPPIKCWRNAPEQHASVTWAQGVPSKSLKIRQIKRQLKRVSVRTVAPAECFL